MVGIRTVALIFGIVLIQTAAFEEENDLHAKFSQLETQVKVLTQRLQQGEEKSTQQELKLTKQEVKLTKQEKLTQRFQKQELKLTQRLQQEEEKVAGLQRQVELLKKQLEDVTDLQSDSKNGRFKDIVGNFQGHGVRENLAPNRRHARSEDPFEVGFTVELSHELKNVPVHSTLKFDHLVYRTGNSYDNSTGVFTCPTSGLYLFAVFIEASNMDTEAYVALKKEGTIYMSVISEQNDPGEDDSGGNVVLLSVNKGERVWVETRNNDNQSFWQNFTTFSGVLIQRH